MLGIPIIGDIIGNIFGIAGDWLKDKRKLKQTKVDAEIHRVQAKTNHIIKMAETGQMADIDWDIQAMKNAQNSWKDEWFVILLSIPAIMAFIPGLAPYVGQGFDELSRAPQWYLAAFGIAVAASFGVRRFANKMIGKN